MSEMKIKAKFNKKIFKFHLQKTKKIKIMMMNMLRLICSQFYTL